MASNLKISEESDGGLNQAGDQHRVNRGGVNYRVTFGTAAAAATGDFATPADLAAKAALVHTHAESDVTGLAADLALKAPLASPTLTGTPLAPTASPGTSSTQIANMAAVEARAQAAVSGLQPKAAVRVATTANITLSGAQTIDGVSVIATESVLVKNQTAPAENGLYLCAAGAWTRRTDADTWAELPNALTFVSEGTVNALSTWICNVAAGGTLNTTSVTWVPYSAQASIGMDGLSDATITGAATGHVLRWNGSAWVNATVDATSLASDAVTTAKILDSNVTAAKLATDAVTTVKIADLNVTAAKIANATITATQLASDAVATAKILNANVTLAKIANAAASSKLLGSGASGSGSAYAELTLGTNLSMSGTTLNATGGSAGGVTGTPNSASTTAAPAVALSTTEVQVGTITITPSSTSAQIMVLADVELTKDTGTTVRACTIRVRRGITNGSTQVGSDLTATSSGVASSAYNGSMAGGFDAPASVALQTYSVRAVMGAGASTAARYTLHAMEVGSGGFDINGLTADATPDATADYLATYDASAAGYKKVLLDNVRASMANAGTGFAQRTLKAKFGEVVSVKDFGATGDGSTDDTTNFQAALTYCAGTYRTLLIPHGNYKCAALDARDVKRIICEGVIKSTITAGQIGIIVGSNFATNMEGGDVQVKIVHNAGSNTGLTTTVGIAVRGALACIFRLNASYFEIGIDLQPTNAVGTQYVAYCLFMNCTTYGTLTALHTIGTTGTFVNENLFMNLLLRNAGNSLAGTQTAILLEGVSPPNNNVFEKPALENWTVPLKIITGIRNTFRDCRFETAGNILLGDGTTSSTCARNTITSQYPQASASIPVVTYDCWAPNFIGGSDGVQWNEIAYIDYDGFSNNGTTYYHRRLHNNTAGKSFTSVVLTSATRSFQFAGSDRGIIYVPVNKGDILKLTLAWTGSPTGSSPCVTLAARDSALALLTALSAGDIPYIGTSNDSSFANSTSGTTNAKDIRIDSFEICRYVSSNRTDLIYLSFELRTVCDYKFFRIERMVTPLASGDAVKPNWQDAKLVADFTTAPDFPGQIGVQVTSGEARSAKSATAWDTQLTSTTTALAAIGNAINTVDKYAGKPVFNTTTSKLVMAVGATAGGVWANAGTGVTEHTPV